MAESLNILFCFVFYQTDTFLSIEKNEKNEKEHKHDTMWGQEVGRRVRSP